MPWALPLFFVLALLVMGTHVFPLTDVSRLSYVADDASLFLWNFGWLREAPVPRGRARCSSFGFRSLRSKP